MTRAQDSVWHPGASQTVAYTGTAGTSSAVSAQTYAVRVVVTTAAFVSLDGTATTSDVYVPANTPEVFQISPGDTVSAIQVSTGGNLHVTELDHV
jgi:hypothetical protein